MMLAATVLASIVPLLLVSRPVAAHCQSRSLLTPAQRRSHVRMPLTSIALPVLVSYLSAVSTLAVAVLEEQFKNSFLVPVRPHLVPPLFSLLRLFPPTHF